MSEDPSIPSFDEIPEPQVVALVAAARAGTKVLQSFLDGHEELLMVPGYPLMYLYPHWSDWVQTHAANLSWSLLIELLCEKHASILDSRKVRGLTGMDRLGETQNEYVKIDEDFFRTALRQLLGAAPIARRTFLLAVHYAYGLCQGQDIRKCPVLFYHLHFPGYLRELYEDFPDLKVVNNIRNPIASVHAGARMSSTVNDSKLNLSDALIYSGRNYRISSQIHFSIFHRLAYLGEDRFALIKLENLHRDLEGCMRRFASWLGIQFTQDLLQSTFDGKLWWGDVKNKEPVNNLDPKAMTDKWKKSLSRIDVFVIEGICYDFLNRYDYSLIVYKKDCLLRRLLVGLCILWPNKAEWKQLAFYLNPASHIRLLFHALNESTGKTPLKDYTWNGTYLYKWTYLDLKLWSPRWYNRFAASGPEGVSVPQKIEDVSLRGLIYVGVIYARFWWAIITYPMELVRRYRIYYGQFFRRLKKKEFMPKLLEEIVKC